jgi:YHS domain-containing protein
VPLRSLQALSDVAHNLRGDVSMLWKEISLGLLVSGFVAQLPNSVWHGLFLTGAPGVLRALWSVVIGPLIAVATSVCSVGNIPLAAVLWSGGISFAGVIAFVFADLLIVPIVLIRRKYYGARYALRVTGLMAVAIVLAALAIGGAFSVLGLVPGGPRPVHADVFRSVRVNYTLVLNVVALLVALPLWSLTLRRGAVDLVCGMAVDRARAVTAEHAGRRWYFCCEGCRERFLGDPDAFAGSGGASELPVAGQPPAATPRHTTIRL